MTCNLLLSVHIRICTWNLGMHLFLQSLLSVSPLCSGVQINLHTNIHLWIDFLVQNHSTFSGGFWGFHLGLMLGVWCPHWL